MVSRQTILVANGFLLQFAAGLFQHFYNVAKYLYHSPNLLAIMTVFIICQFIVSAFVGPYMLDETYLLYV